MGDTKAIPIADDVRNIIETDLADDIINAYIKSACVMTQSLTGKTHADVLRVIREWVTAHMIASTRERQASKEGAGGAYVEYGGMYGEGLHSTSYGQMAITLDTTGTLSGLSGRGAWVKAVPGR